LSQTIYLLYRRSDHVRKLVFLGHAAQTDVQIPPRPSSVLERTPCIVIRLVRLRERGRGVQPGSMVSTMLTVWRLIWPKHG